jgi:hypothetical protein
MIEEGLVFEVLRDDYISEKARKDVKDAYDKNDQKQLEKVLENIFITELTKYYLQNK